MQSVFVTIPERGTYDAASMRRMSSSWDRGLELPRQLMINCWRIRQLRFVLSNEAVELERMIREDKFLFPKYTGQQPATGRVARTPDSVASRLRSTTIKKCSSHVGLMPSGGCFENHTQVHCRYPRTDRRSAHHRGAWCGPRLGPYKLRNWQAHRPRGAARQGSGRLRKRSPQGTG